ncbi:transposable element Tcb1 transposase [Trichonephila clavipes]|uniref:Transposable element Tcb1 transposase n=1 Tax=Trichonephila clavipes TaxID=2585209 RepID=A0A8X7B7S7_TRICX|nr:transposable element Tcb1 transposase [Trichonephila clavipes]
MGLQYICLQYTVTLSIDPWQLDILQPRVLPLMQLLPGAIFQQDNARASHGVSPIEHIWDHLGRQVGHPMSLNELETSLQQIWNEMSQDIIQNLYASMSDRIVSCIHARRGSTGS